MKKTLVIFILTVGLLNTAKADTIDYWHVFYNKTKIKEFNENSKNMEITLKVKEIKKTDSLTIRYFRDVYYIDCEAKVEIEDSLKFVLAKGIGIGRGASLKISVFDLLVTARKSPFFAYYYDCATRDREKRLVFKVEFK